jgi:hypothetical protein
MNRGSSGRQVVADVIGDGDHLAGRALRPVTSSEAF